MSRGRRRPGASTRLAPGLLRVVEVMGRYSNLEPFKVLPEVEAYRSLPSEPAPKTHKLDQRLSPELIAELIAAYESGLPTNKLMKQFNLSKGSVLKLLREASVRLRNQGIPDEAASEVTRLYVEQEWSSQRIGDRHGCDAETVRKFLRKHGVEVRPRNGWPRP